MTSRALFLLGVLAGLFGAVGSLFGTVGAALALSLAVLISFWAYWAAAPTLLATLRAVPCTDSSIAEMVVELAERAAIPSPSLYEIDDAQPNALAIGPNPKASAIILTSELGRLLCKEEIRAVLAHEIAHIRNQDIFVRTIATSFVSAIASLAMFLGFLGLATRRHGGGTMILLALLAPLFALVLKFAMIRSSEYRADHDGALLCGNPQDLIAALRNLSLFASRIESTAASLQPALAPAFFVDPITDSWLGSLFSAHPPIAKRIARLEDLDRRAAPYIRF